MMRLLVAVHDVTPAHRERLERVFALLDRLGASRAALLVVPDWHGVWPLESDPEFVATLRRRQEAGAEVFLHGYRHDEGSRQRSLGDRLRVFGRTAGAAEFLFLGIDQVAARLERGRAVLERVGLHPVGFVPPAWLFGRGLLRLLPAHGMPLTEGFWTIRETESGRRLLAPVLSWSTARPWRSTVTARLAERRVGIERRRSVVRVAIHPLDIDVPVVARSLERTLAVLLQERELTSYRDVLPRRAHASPATSR
jgi:uncharacterized protein